MKKIIVLPVVTVFAVLILAFSGAGAVGAAYAEENVVLPVLMYHSMLNSRSGTYIVSESQFEGDLRALAEAGYVTVFPSEVIAYVRGDGNLPEKPVMLTFDDGHYNNMYYALPLLKKYSAKALISVIGAFSEYSTVSGDDSNPNYSHLTWEQIGELAASGYFEIGNHTYNMHKYKPRFGIMPIYGESEETYREKITADISRLQEKLESAAGLTPNVFAFPFGKYNDVSTEVLTEMGFEMMLTCNEGVNVVARGDVSALTRVKRINRSGSYSTDTVMAKLKGARN